VTAPTQNRVVIEAEVRTVVLPDGKSARVLRLHFADCPHCWEVGADRMLLSDMTGCVIEEPCRQCEGDR